MRADFLPLNTERNHQGIGNELIEPQGSEQSGARVVCREQLGGLLLAL